MQQHTNCASGICRLARSKGGRTCRVLVELVAQWLRLGSVGKLLHDASCA